MKIAKVFYVMIGAPSDIKEEIEIARDVIFKWNDNNISSNVVLLPLHWSTNTYPISGKHPQSAINEQIVSESDLMVCIFGARFGTRTDLYPSGTEEEIEEHLKNGKNVMVFFKNKINIKDIDKNQFNALVNFKKRHKTDIYWEEYDDENDFSNIFRNKLNLFVNNVWLNPNYNSTDEYENVELQLDKQEINVVCKGIGYVSLTNFSLDKCTFKVEDDYVAYALASNGKIEISGRKVGNTKLIITYGNSVTECLIKITPLSIICGNPILDFGRNREFIEEQYNKFSSRLEDDNEIFIEDLSGTYYILYKNIYINDILDVVQTCIIKRDKTSISSVDVINCMYERYVHIGNIGNVYWYQYKDSYYIASVPHRTNKEVLYIIYGKEKANMEKCLKDLSEKIEL